MAYFFYHYTQHANVNTFVIVQYHFYTCVYRISFTKYWISLNTDSKRTYHFKLCKYIIIYIRTNTNPSYWNEHKNKRPNKYFTHSNNQDYEIYITFIISFCHKMHILSSVYWNLQGSIHMINLFKLKEAICPMPCHTWDAENISLLKQYIYIALTTAYVHTAICTGPYTVWCKWSENFALPKVTSWHLWHKSKRKRLQCSIMSICIHKDQGHGPYKARNLLT